MTETFEICGALLRLWTHKTGSFASPTFIGCIQGRSDPVFDKKEML